MEKEKFTTSSKFAKTSYALLKHTLSSIKNLDKACLLSDRELEILLYSRPIARSYLESIPFKELGNKSTEEVLKYQSIVEQELYNEVSHRMSVPITSLEFASFLKKVSRLSPHDRPIIKSNSDYNG